MDMMGPLPNRKSDLFVRNGILLCKEIIHPMMDYACTVWRPAPIFGDYRCYNPSVFALLLVPLGT